MRYSYWLALALPIGTLSHAQAQTAEKYVWEEFSKRIESSEKVAPLGPNLAGESVSLSNGALSFRVVDVSLPGNNALKVEFGRTYSVIDRKNYLDADRLGDWEVDVPRISGVFAPDWTISEPASQNRCSVIGPPTRPTPSPFTITGRSQLRTATLGIDCNVSGLWPGPEAECFA